MTRCVYIQKCSPATEVRCVAQDVCAHEHTATFQRRLLFYYTIKYLPGCADSSAYISSMEHGDNTRHRLSDLEVVRDYNFFHPNF